MSAACLTRPDRIRGPVDHATTLHAAGRGNVTIARRDHGVWRESSYPVDDLACVVPQLAGRDDVYLTMNRFVGRRRLVTRLLELDALYVDLDYYKTGVEGAPEHVLELALDRLDQARLPTPSVVLSSGRGLVLVWLHEAVPRAALPRWRACQQRLAEALLDLGADRLATDAARVLRLAGTRNSRSGAVVEAITPNGQVWDFDLLADEILPLARAELVALRLERARRRGEGRGKVEPVTHFTSASLWELRLAELQRLLQHRWFGQLPEGERDAWMFVAGIAVGYLVPAPMVRREVVALADEVTGGRWREQETISRMSSVIRRAEQAARGEKVEYRGRLVDPRYRMKTTTIIDWLDISEAEMRACGFRHLVTPEIRREHHRLGQEQRRRAAGAPPRAEYEAASFAQQKPWEKEGVSRRTWYRRRHGTGPCRCMVA